MNNMYDLMSGGLPINMSVNSLTDNNATINNSQDNNTQTQTIAALVKHSGEVVGYELSNGEKVTKERGVELAKKGLICGVSVSISKKGEEYLRSSRDGDESNNLNSLPIITE